MIQQHIDRIVQLSKLTELTSEALDQLYGLNRDLGLNLFDPAWIERRYETNISEKALETYLNNLSQDDLERIQAIMYAGRDNDSAVSLKSTLTNNREDMIRVIIEKGINLETYLANGLVIAKAECNIDTF